MKFFNRVPDAERTQGPAIAGALFAGFLALTLIVAATDYWSLSTMEKLHAQARSIADNQWIDVQLANEAVGHSNANSRIIMQLIVTRDPEEATSLLADREKNSAKISALAEQLQTRVNFEKERQLLDTVNATRVPYLESCKRAIDTLREDHNPELARQMLVRVTFPALLRYHQAWSDFVQFQTDEMNAELAATSTKYIAARKLTTYLMAVSILLVLNIAIVVIWKITAEYIAGELPSVRRDG